MTLAESRLIPPICLSSRVLIGAMGGNLGNSLFEVTGIVFLLVILLFEEPKLAFAKVNASVILMSLWAVILLTSLLIRILKQLLWKVG